MAAATQLRCETCGVFKGRDQFSMSQLAKYNNKARQGTATPGHTGISCKTHNAGPSQEIKCEGPCGRWRELRYFSKSTRKKGQNVCIDCGSYYRFLEPGQSLPPPNSEWSVDELANTADSVSVVPFPDDDEEDYPPYSDIESDECDSDGPPSRIRPIRINKTASGATDTLADSNVGSQNNNASTQNNSSISGATEALAKLKVNCQETGESKKAAPTKPSPPGLPKAPHWFLPPMEDLLVRESVSSSAAAGKAPGPDYNHGNEGVAIHFNAWGPDGEFSQRIKTPTVTSATTYGTTQTDETKKGGWAKVSSRKYPPMLPDYLKGPQEVEYHDDDGNSEDERW
ncbi:hypothetical protein VTK26DRAFT_3284 [Humicola hyalothermophila]